MRSCPHCGGELPRQAFGRGLDLPDEAIFTLQNFRARASRGAGRWDPTISAQLSWYMAQLKANGYTLEAIAAPLAISRQGAQQRINRARPIHGVPTPPAPPPPAVLPAPPPPPPQPEIPAKTRARLRALREQATNLRGNHSPAHPARRASEELTRLIARLVEDGFTYREIAEPMGLKPASVKARLQSHGYLPKPPSRKSYAASRTEDRSTAS